MDVEKLREELRDLFCSHEERQIHDLLDIFKNDLPCECAHKSRIQLVQDRMMWFQRMTRFYQILLVVLSLILMLLSYGFWLARQYNRANIFGSCAAFWPFDDCAVAF